jgi:tRNA (Thr-GGU) A37 N-methylase
MEQLKNLLQLMETNGRVLDVDSLQILGGDPVTKFKIVVKAYAYEKVSK